MTSKQALKAMDFLTTCTPEEILIILECALAGLRDELSDGFLRAYGVLDLDLSDETLEPILDKLARFMETNNGGD